jgi:hypothetical protein
MPTVISDSLSKKTADFSVSAVLHDTDTSDTDIPPLGKLKTSDGSGFSEQETMIQMRLLHFPLSMTTQILRRNINLGLIGRIFIDLILMHDGHMARSTV